MTAPWIYSDKVKELFLHPKNYLHGSEQDFAFDAKGTAGNPVCGDEMIIYIKVSHRTKSGDPERAVLGGSRRGTPIEDSSEMGEETDRTQNTPTTSQILPKKTNDIITDIKWKTYGCASAIASTSALSELAKGKTISEAQKITPKQIENYLGGLPKHKFHCSVLGMEALTDAIKNYQDKL